MGRTTVVIVALSMLVVGGCGAGGGGGAGGGAGGSTGTGSSTGTGGSTGGGSTGSAAGSGSLSAQITHATDYVVLVDDPLATAIAPLVASHVALGRKVAVVPLSAVQASGRDRAEQIRAFLVAQCNDGVVRDLLLVGGPLAIPYRTCQVGPTTRAVVSDLYYGNLTGNWDQDGNGVYGELANDAPGFDAQLRVGRIPYDDPADVATAVTAIERARAGAAWRSGCLLVGAEIVVPGDAPLACESVKAQSFGPDGWSVTRAYSAASPIAGDFALGAGAIAASVAAQPEGLVFCICHGDASSLASHDPAGWLDFLTAAELASFPKDRPAVLVAAACEAGVPSGGGGLGESCLRQGLAGFVGATTTVDPTSGGGAGLQAEFDIAQLIADGRPLGEALAATVSRYASAGLAAAKDVASREEVYVEAMSAILYGDPALKLGPKGP